MKTTTVWIIAVFCFISNLAHAQSTTNDPSVFLKNVAQQQNAQIIKKRALYASQTIKNVLSSNQAQTSTIGTENALVNKTNNVPPFLDPIYSEVIPVSSGLYFNPVSDTMESFIAPNGKTVTALVKGPDGVYDTDNCPTPVHSSTYCAPAISKNETPDTYFPAMVNEALNKGAHRLVFPPGVYNFTGPTMVEGSNPNVCSVNYSYNCGSIWTIGNYGGPIIQDLEIDGSGSTLNFPTPSNGIQIWNVQRLRLVNFTIDYPTLPMASLGTIVVDPLNPKHKGVVVDPDYPVTAMNKNYTVNGYPQIDTVNLWNGGNSLSDPGNFDQSAGNNNPADEVYFFTPNSSPYDPQPVFVGQTSQGVQTYSCKTCGFATPANPSCNFFTGCANFDDFPTGSRVILGYFYGNGSSISINWSDDVELVNLNMYTIPGNAIDLSNNGTHRGFLLKGSNLSRIDPYKLLGAGTMPIGDMQGDIIIENNKLGYWMDDAIDLYSNESPVTAVNSVTASQAIVQVAAQCEGLCSISSPQFYPEPNDYLVFFDNNGTYMGMGKVNAAKLSSDYSTLTLTLNNCYGGNCSALSHLNTNSSYTDLSQEASARFIIKNNVFEYNRGHANYINSPYGLIDGNTDYYDDQGNISLNNNQNYGFGPSNIVISNNHLTTPNNSKSATDFGGIVAIAQQSDGSINPSNVFQKLVITGNHFFQDPGFAIFLGSTHDLYIGSNVIDNSNQYNTSGPLPGYNDSISIYNANVGEICDTEFALDSTHGPIGIDPSTTSDVTVCNPPVIKASAGTGGTIIPSGEVAVNYGTNQTFTVMPDTGNEPTLTVDGKLVTLSDDQYTLQDVTSNHTVVANFLPAVPTGLSATAGDHQVSLSWKASAGATSYEIFRTQAASASGPVDFSVLKRGITSTTYIDTSVGYGTYYYYEVAAVNAAGVSPSSSYVQIATPNAPPPVASAIATPASGKVPLTVSFNASASTTTPGVLMTSYSWNFGDGTTGSGVISSHVYTKAGSYNAVLTVADNYGGSGTYAVSNIKVGE